MSMGEFPAFMRNPADRIAAASQHADAVEGYVFDGPGFGRQRAMRCADAPTVTDN
jgi:hypothetical protein